MPNPNKPKYPITIRSGHDGITSWTCTNHGLSGCGCDLVDDEGKVLPQYEDFVKYCSVGGIYDQEDEEYRKQNTRVDEEGYIWMRQGKVQPWMLIE